MTSVNRDASGRGRAARALGGQAIGWLVLVMNAVGLYLSMRATDDYNSYSGQFEDDCGRLVTMPLGIAVMLWLALAMAAASVVLAVGWSRHRRRARGLAGFPVRGIGLVLVCLGVLVTAWCLLCAAQSTGFHVVCGPPGP